MRANRIFFASGLIFFLTVVFTLDALAQFPGGGTGGMRRGSRGESGRGTIQPPQQSMNNEGGELLEFRLGMLEEDLKLTPVQLKLWDNYADRMREMAADAQRERGNGRPSPAVAAPNALQQINKSLDAARDRLTGLEDVAAAAKQLYDALGTEQRMLVDSRMPTLLPLVAGGTRPASAGGERGAAPDGGFGGPPRDGTNRRD